MDFESYQTNTQHCTSVCMPVKKHSFVYHSLMGLMDINHVGFKDWVLGGDVPQVEVLKVGASAVQSESFA